MQKEQELHRLCLVIKELLDAEGEHTQSANKEEKPSRNIGALPGLLGMKEDDQIPAVTKTERNSRSKNGVYRCESSRSACPLLDAGDNLHNVFSVSVFTSRTFPNLCAY